MAEKTLKVTAAQIEESVEKSHNHSNLSTLNNISSSRISEWDDKADKEHRHNASEIDGLDNLDVDLSNYYTKTQTDNKIATEINSINLSSYAKISEIPNATSDLTNDSNFATQTFVTNKIAEAQLDSGNVDLSNYYTKEEIDTNKANKTHSHAISEITDLATKITSLETNIANLINTNTTLTNKITALETKVAELDLQLNPPIVEEMYYGRLSIADVGGSVIQYNQITEAMIKKGVADGKLTKTAPKTMGKTSMGLASETAEMDYIVIAVPTSKNYTVRKDNGIGGKVIFDESTSGSGNGIDITINNVACKLYGEVLLSQSEIFIYVD